MGESVTFCSFKKYLILSMPINHLTPKNMQNNAQHHANNDHGNNRKINTRLPTWGMIADIARQFTKP